VAGRVFDHHVGHTRGERASGRSPAGYPLAVPTPAIQPVNCSRALRVTRDLARPAGRSGGLGGLVELPGLPALARHCGRDDASNMAASLRTGARSSGDLKGGQRRSCSLLILTEETTEQVASTHPALLLLTNDGHPGTSIRRLEP
jgi:hypothetical protein